jgi:hypothetical protein
MDLIRKTNFQTQNYKVTDKIYWHYDTLNEILLQLYIVGLSSEKNNTNVSPSWQHPILDHVRGHILSDQSVTGLQNL